jgi:phosphoribosylformylglycinamidine synthase
VDSNSDVLGSAKVGQEHFIQRKSKTALDNFFKREDTLSVGICNGCQLFMELSNQSGLKYTEKCSQRKSKHESIFTSVTVQDNKSVMLSTLAGSTLGLGFTEENSTPMGEDKYNIVAKYGYEGYPANPNGSDFNTCYVTLQVVI